MTQTISPLMNEWKYRWKSLPGITNSRGNINMGCKVVDLALSVVSIITIYQLFAYIIGTVLLPNTSPD